MPTVNEEYFDAMIRHQVYLMRLSGSVRNRVTKLLNATEHDIADQIRKRLASHKGLNTIGVKKLLSLEKYIKTVRGRAWDQVDEVWLEEIIALAKAEPAFAAASLTTVSPVLLDLHLPDASLLESLVKTSPFEGRTLGEWSKSLRDTDIKRMSDQIKIGMVQGQTSAQIARRIVGAASLKGRDGTTEITRRNATAITRTAINHIANAAKREFYKANDDVFDMELYVATLDSRTTPICQSLDGETYAIGVGPIPPMHWNCRSLRVAIIDGVVLGDRPFKASTKKQLLREYGAEHKIKATSRDTLPFGHKGKYDDFARKRIRELTGQVPAKVNYQEWITRQSNTFQDDVLGVTKGRLFRKGDLTLDKFVNRNGDELTLSELASKHSSAFTAAGLNPESFLTL